MYKTISTQLIKKIESDSDLLNLISSETEELPIKDWVQKYRNVVPAKDILWLLLRKKFLSEKDLRLFAVWCAREALKVVKNPDERSAEACNVAEKFANGEATKEELYAAHIAAINAGASAARNTAAYAAIGNVVDGIISTADADAASAAGYATYTDAHAAYYDTAHAAYYAARDAADAAHDITDAAYYAARAAATAARADANAYLAVTSAARVVYFATFAAIDTVSNDDADAAYAATRTSQLDKLLTYFE